MHRLRRWIDHRDGQAKGILFNHGTRRYRQSATLRGDNFKVAVRGSSLASAKVIDQANGEYWVEYKPSTSGSYSISVSLNGVSFLGVRSDSSAHARSRPCKMCVGWRGTH